MGTRTRTRAAALTAATGAGLLLLVACGSGSSLYGGSSSNPTPAPAKTGQIGVASTSDGKVLVDPSGRTLYVFAPDPQGQSTCSGSCATYWPPVPGADAKSTAASTVSAKIGDITRADGSSQLTVNGYPVYTYVGDHAPGEVNGQGTNLSGGLWWVISPTGTRITDASTPSAGSSGYGRGGY